ncbi:MAG: DUF302 domain-containing protein [Gammaproteobacteria bacterium]|jgi:uncharacterized protein (DUF302 family)|nr:MAG: DUF302 domain-containing protein [Gammaproteobacteria bacterium]
MRFILSALAGAVLVVSAVSADDGLISVKSGYAVDQTLDRFERAARDKGMTVFARIDHAAGAAKVDKVLRPTELLIFGNPKAGTPLMQSRQTVAIDLPMKALAWADSEGQVWLTYNDPGYLVQRHDITDRDPLVEKMRRVLGELSAAATATVPQAPAKLQ